MILMFACEDQGKETIIIKEVESKIVDNTGESQSEDACTRAASGSDEGSTAGTLVFSIEENVDPCSVQVELVGEQNSSIEVLPIEDGSIEVSGLPPGESDIIVTAGTLQIDPSSDAPESQVDPSSDAPESSSLLLTNGEKRTLGIRKNGVVVTPGEKNDLGTMDLPPMGKLKGQVSFFQKNNHSLIQVVLPGTQFSAWSDSSGFFSFNFLPVGTHEIVVVADGYYRNSLANVEVTSNQISEIEPLVLFPDLGSGGSLIIENGDEVTNKRDVNLLILASPDSNVMMISEDSNFANLSFQALEKSTTYTFDSDGNKKLYLKIANSNGIESTISSEIIVDTIPPSLAIATDKATIKERSLVLDLTAEDVTSEITEVIIAENEQFSNVSWQKFKPTMNFTLSQGSGSKTVFVKVKDALGHTSEVKSLTIQMDVEPPQFTSIGFTGALADAYLNATERASELEIFGTLEAIGYDLAEYVIVSETTICDSNVSYSELPKSDDSAITADGTYKVCVKLTDNADNTPDFGESESFTVDTAAPSSPSFTLTDFDGGSQSGFTNTLKQDIQVSSCPDDVTGIYFSESSTTPELSLIDLDCTTGAGDYTITFSDSSQGSKTAYIFARDVAGNISSAGSASISYDTVAPLITNVYINEINTTSVKISWSTNEPTLNTIDYGPASGSPDKQYEEVSYSTSHSVTLTNMDNRELNYFTISAADRVGMTSTTTEDDVKTTAVTKMFHYTINRTLGSGNHAMDACDINNDGNDDLVVSDSSVAGEVYVYLGGTGLEGNKKMVTYSGDSSNSSEADITIYRANGNFGNMVYCMDYNGDGIDDILLGQYRDDGYILYGPISADVDIDVDGYDVNYTDGSGSSSVIGNVEVGNFKTDGAFAYDDYMRCVTSTCVVYYGNGAGSLTFSGLDWLDGELDSGTFADADADGVDDLLLGSETYDHNFVSNTGRIRIFKGGSSPDNTLDYEITSDTANHELTFPYVGDIDGDGKNDYIIKQGEGSSGNYDIVWGLNASEWAAASNKIVVTRYELYFSSFNHPRGATNNSHVKIRDINQDGYDDVIMGQGSQVVIHFGKSRSEWTALGPAIYSSEAELIIQAGTSSDQMGSTVSVGNFDGTGTLEVFFTSPGGDSDGNVTTDTGEAGIVYFDWPPPSPYQNLKIDLSNEF